MKQSTKRYTGEQIDVLFDVKRCIHAAECVRRLPSVFDTEKRPWVQPDNADADTVADVVSHCPTGALYFERRDGGAAEASTDENQVRIVENGPLYIQGALSLTVDDIAADKKRVALCRCGHSRNMPFCDSSHQEAGFEDAGHIPGDSSTSDATGTLIIKPVANGPLLLQGGHCLKSDDGDTTLYANKQALCRCGGSANKPFCDGSHKDNDFTTEESR